MPGGFVKLYGTILDSSVWSEDPHTRLVWITMLAMADADGFVEAAVPGLARRANVPLDACEAALERLQAPDPYSKSPEHEGRRIERAERGWRILNYKSYRELRTERQVKDAVRQKRHRDELKRDMSRPSRQVSASPSVVSSLGEGSGEREDDRAERRIRESKIADERKLLALVSRMEQLDPKGRDAASLMRLVTSYDKADGRRIGGCVNPATLSYERVRKSIEDAEAQIADWEAKRGA